MFSDRMYEREEVVTANPHPIATGISMSFIMLGVFGFICLAIFASSGCASPPDTECAETSGCGDDEVDGGDTDQPDGGTDCNTDGTCPDGGADTDAPSTATCTTNAWMENPEMFDCDFFEEDGTVYTAHSCDPELNVVGEVCAIKCGPFTASPDQLSMDLLNHSFDYRYTPGSTYPTYRCTQRAQ